MSAAVQVKPQGPGRPKDMEKRAAILEAAKALFIRNAFAGTSMDAVAAEAGVSKLTVYSHFGDKDNLFREVVRSRMHDLLPASTYAFDPGVTIGEKLHSIATLHTNLDCDKENVGTFRAILSDCRQGNPRYGRVLWEEVTARKYGLMSDLLQRAVDERQLQIPDVRCASMQFFALITGDLKMRRMFGCDECPQAYAKDLAATARAGVATFLRAHAVQ